MRVPARFLRAGLALALLVPSLVSSLAPSPATARSRPSPGNLASRLRNLEAPDSQGEQPTAFSLDGQFVNQLSYERMRQGNHVTDLAYDRAAVSAKLQGPAGLSLSTTLRLEPGPSSPAGLVPRHTGYAETLILRWTQDPWRVFAGKINPRFGAAWSRAPGVFGADYASDYQLREKLGAGARIWVDDILDLPDPLGYQSLQFEVFQADTSFLSASAFAPRWSLATTEADPLGGTETTTIRQRWRASRQLGGADNRRGLGGMTVSWVGTEHEVPGGQIAYNAGVSLRRAGLDAQLAGRATNEVGSVAGIEGAFPLGADFRLVPALEYARRTGADGYQGRNADWWTAALTLKRGALSLAYAWMQRRETDAPVAEHAIGRQHTANATLDLGRATGLALLTNAAVSLDWRRRTELGERIQGFGTSFVVSLPF